MITLLAISGHLLLNLWTGWTFLSFFPGNRSWAESLAASLLCGIYLETLFIASMHFIGVPIKVSIFILSAGILVLMIISWRRGNINIQKFSIGKPKWYEWILLLSIGEKIIFIVWKLLHTPLFFDDAMTHWSGRARSLFGGVNWSLNPDSSVFLGYTGLKHYPLATPIWRTVTATFNGSWNDIIGRVDGLIFFIAIILITWCTVWRFSQKRWLAAIASFIVAALPLQIWHAGAGYSDIAVEVFAVASLAALLRKEWLLAGILAAGTAWSKNDGLIVFIPGLLVMSMLLQSSQKQGKECNGTKKKTGKISFIFYRE